MSPLDLQYVGSFQIGRVFSSENPLEEVWGRVARWGTEEWVRSLVAKQTPPITVPWQQFGPYALVRMRQAVEFRAVARAATLLTAPLPLYYAFLNLERGLFALREQRPPVSGHGLKFRRGTDILDCAAEIAAGTFADYLTALNVPFSIGQAVTLREALSRIPELVDDLHSSSIFSSEVVVCQIRAMSSGSATLHFSIPAAQEPDFRAKWQAFFPGLASDCDLEPAGAVLRLKSTVDTSDYEKLASFCSKQLATPLLLRDRAYWYAIPASTALPNLPRPAWYFVSMFILGSTVRYEPELLAAISVEDSELHWLLSRYLRFAERFFPQLKLMELYGHNVFF